MLLLLVASVGATAFDAGIAGRLHGLPRAAGHASCRPVVLRMQRDAPNLKDVMLKPCKTLCKGCVPYICPLAPLQAEEDMEKVQVTFLPLCDPNLLTAEWGRVGYVAWQISESQQRMIELRKEDELQRERERMEAIADGVIHMDSRQEFEQKCVMDTTGRLMVVFWGGSWCRKCTALKPEFVKLTVELTREYGKNILSAYCDAKAISRATDQPPSAILKDVAGVSVVPTIQCWRNGEILSEYVTGVEKKDVMPAVRKMVAEHII